MRIAALYDIHGNLPALEAVLEEVRRLGVDEIVVGGDVWPGPMPVETLECLRGLEWPIRFLSGNGDREVLAAARGEESETLPQTVRDILRWTAGQLRPEHLAFVASWPATLCRQGGEGGEEVFFCHATPESDTEIFTRVTAPTCLAKLFKRVGSKTVVCGHTHMQFDLDVSGVRVLNAGSVGMPFGEPGAYWLLLDPEPKLRRTEYDLENAAELVRESGYPEAEQFAAGNILRPPCEADMLARFSKASP